MNKLIAYLRDPIWQAIGVAIAIFTIVLTTNNAKENSDLTVYHYHSLKFEDYQLPTDQIRLVLSGTSEDINAAIVDYFVVKNSSKKPIVAADFALPISISAGPKTEKIYLSTSSCGKSGTDGIYQPTTATSVVLNWFKDGEYWRVQPTLINPNEYACVTVISKARDKNEKLAPVKDRFVWNARIVNVALKAYDSQEAYAKTLEKSWTQALETTVSLSGFAAYWFVIFQVTAFYLTITLAVQANVVNTMSQKGLLWITGIVLLCTGTAEVLTDIFINLNILNLHFAVWLFLAAHGFCVLFLFFRARAERNRISQPL